MIKEIYNPDDRLITIMDEMEYNNTIKQQDNLLG